jgi:hypothetical protein
MELLRPAVAQQSGSTGDIPEDLKSRDGKVRLHPKHTFLGTYISGDLKKA